MADKKKKDWGKIISGFGSMLSGAASGYLDPAGTFKAWQSKQLSPQDQLNQALALKLMENIGGGTAPSSKDIDKTLGDQPDLPSLSQTAFNQFADPMEKLYPKPSGFALDPRYESDLSVATAGAKERMKADIAEKKKLKEEKRQGGNALRNIGDMYELYTDALMELESKYPGASEATFEGRLNRLLAKGESNIAQTMPKTQAFLRSAKLYSYKQARAIEGGRVTDQDVNIVFDALFKTDIPREQAMIQAEAYVKSLKDKGLSEEELKPLIDLIDLNGGEIMVDTKTGARAFVVNGEVRRVIE
jgi:hypothetical protein